MGDCPQELRLQSHYSELTVITAWNRRSYIPDFTETIDIPRELPMLQNCQRGLEQGNTWWELMFEWEEIQFG